LEFTIPVLVFWVLIFFSFSGAPEQKGSFTKLFGAFQQEKAASIEVSVCCC